MTKLNQILAIETTAKNRSNEFINQAYKTIQKEDLFAGLTKSYIPLDEENGESTTTEQKTPQANAETLLKELAQHWTRLINLTATKDYANTKAHADIRLPDGTLLATDVPTHHLLWLEKQLNDLHTFIKKLPILNPAETWRKDPNTGHFVTDTIETKRHRKELKVLVKYEATKEHAAQTETYTEDVPVGTLYTIKFSSSLQATRQKQLLERVESLQEAVRMAREEANMLEIDDQQVGTAIFSWLLA